MHTKLTTTIADNLTTVEAELRNAPGPEAETLSTQAVHVYWHKPTDGTAPYLVVEVDDNGTDTGVRVYFNDGLIHDTTKEA